MEPNCQDLILKEDGAIQMYLHNLMYIDFSQNIQENFHKLEETLNYYGIEKKKNKIYLSPRFRNKTVKSLDQIKRKKNYIIEIKTSNNRLFDSFSKFTLLKYINNCYSNKKIVKI